MRNITLIIICLLGAVHSYAQELDTIRQAERPLLKKGYELSPMYYYSRARATAYNKDSITASEWLQKVPGHYLVWNWRNSSQPDTFFNNWWLPAGAKEQALSAYKAALQNRNETWKRFEAMAEEDQRIRNMQDKCGDSITCWKLSRQMRISDSIHFKFLYGYVAAHGWPSYEDGGMYATILAIHDHEHHNFYMPLLKRAAAEGRFDPGALELINYHMANAISNEALTRLLNAPGAIRIDISEMLNYTLPASLPRIQKTVKSLCKTKFKYYYIFFAPNYDHMSKWMNKYPMSGDNHIMRQLNRELHTDCPGRFNEDVWYVSTLIDSKIRLIMLIVPR